MEPRFTVKTERADHVIGSRAGFNAFASWKDLHPDVGSPEPPLVFRVVANVEEEDGCISHYTVAEFFSSRPTGKPPPTSTLPPSTGSNDMKELAEEEDT